MFNGHSWWCGNLLREVWHLQAVIHINARLITVVSSRMDQPFISVKEDCIRLLIIFRAFSRLLLRFFRLLDLNQFWSHTISRLPHWSIIPLIISSVILAIWRGMINVYRIAIIFVERMIQNVCKVWFIHMAWFVHLLLLILCWLISLDKWLEVGCWFLYLFWSLCITSCFGVLLLFRHH